MLLKPCPCCGGKAARQVTIIRPKTSIFCTRCGLATRWGSPEDVVAQWNSRYAINRWVWTQTELPPQEVDVLVYRQSEDVGACIDIAHIKSGEWRSTADGWRWDDVSHWMPLPEVP